jgi:UDP-glucose 4-epimerase
MVVTGGAGFIGSALVDRLLQLGHRVAVVDDLSTGRLANLTAAHANHGDRLRVLELDIRSPALADAMADESPAVVFHLAAQVDVRVSVRDPAADASVNVVGAVNVLECARRAGVGKVVYAASGGTLYGEPPDDRLPLHETEPWQPTSPYGVAKRTVLDYLAVYARLHGLRSASLALANVYGPRQAAHGGDAAVVAAFAGCLLQGRPGTVFGDGLQTRDLVYVDDVADAFVRAVDRADGLVVNIGTGVETSVLEVHRLMAAAAGVAAPPVFAPARLGELERSALDVTLAADVLGWRPATTLAEGLSRTLAWFRSEAGRP